MLARRVRFSAAHQLASVTDVPEIRCMLWELAQWELYIHFIIYHVIEEWEGLSAGSAALKIGAFSGI